MEEYFSILLGKMVLQRRSWTGRKGAPEPLVSSNRSVGEIFPITTFVIPNVPQIAWQLQLGGMKASVELEGQKESPGGRFLGVSLTEILICSVKGGAGTLGSHRYRTSPLRHSCLEKSWRKKPQKPNQTKPIFSKTGLASRYWPEMLEIWYFFSTSTWCSAETHWSPTALTPEKGVCCSTGKKWCSEPTISLPKDKTSSPREPLELRVTLVSGEVPPLHF